MKHGHYKLLIVGPVVWRNNFIGNHLPVEGAIAVRLSDRFWPPWRMWFVMEF